MRKPAKTTTTVASGPRKPKHPAPTPLAPTSDKRQMESHEMLMDASVHNAACMETWGKFVPGELDLGKLVKELRSECEKVKGGDMHPIEEMLFGQAMTLQTIYTSLARRANASEHMSQFQSYLNLGLRAQSQCRATLEALAEVKNPRSVAFVRQANIAAGPQQVNNGVQAPGTGSPTPARESQPEPSKQLEASHGERLDFGAQGAAGGAHQDLASVGALDRAAD